MGQCRLAQRDTQGPGSADRDTTFLGSPGHAGTLDRADPLADGTARGSYPGIMLYRLTTWIAGAAPALAATFSLTLLSGCGSEIDAPPGWQVVKRGELNAASAALLESAESARNGLARGLVGELTAAIQEGGHVSAIGVCQERAPAIAATVSAEAGVKIGRTSAQLRQPGNQAPEWAQDHLAAAPEEALFIQGDKELRALFPIMIAPVCLACHGQEADLGDGVGGALAERYPADQAVGYKDGDLRGWFWVEASAD